MIVVGANMAILQVNQAFETLVGWTRVELLNKRAATTLATGDDGKRLDRMLRGGLAGQFWVGCERVRTRAKQVLELSVRLSILHSGRERNLLVLVTGWKNASAVDGASDLDLRYEISLSPFGILKRAQGGVFQTMAHAGVGRFCFEVLHGREVPCAECPAAQLDDNPRASVIRCSSSSSGTCVARAERIDAATARVVVWQVERELVRKLINARVEISAERFGLTEREREVLSLAIDGRTTSEMAATLDISPSTAKFHMANVLAKLGAESRIDLLRHLL